MAQAPADSALPTRGTPAVRTVRAGQRAQAILERARSLDAPAAPTDAYLALLRHCGLTDLSLLDPDVREIVRNACNHSMNEFLASWSQCIREQAALDKAADLRRVRRNQDASRVRSGDERRRVHAQATALLAVVRWLEGSANPSFAISDEVAAFAKETAAAALEALRADAGASPVESPSADSRGPGNEHPACSGGPTAPTAGLRPASARGVGPGSGRRV